MIETVTQELNVIFPNKLKAYLPKGKKIVRNVDIPVEVDMVESLEGLLKVNTNILPEKIYSGKPVFLSIEGTIKILEKKENLSQSLVLNFSCSNVVIFYDLTSEKIIVNDLGRIDFSQKLIN